MSYKDYSTLLEFEGCRYDTAVKNKIEEMIRSIENRPAPVRASFELEVAMDVDGNVRTMTKNSDGLSDAESRLFDQLDELAQDVSKKGGRPNKVKTEVEVEKEV